MKHNRRALGYALILVTASLLIAKEAGAELTIEPLESSVPTPVDRGEGAQALTTCVVGNASPGSFALPDFIAPPVKYAVTFVPEEVCTICPAGVRVTTVHIVLQTDEAMAIEMGATVAAVDSNIASCPEPGAALCSTAIDQILLPGPGLWDVAIPISDCPCLDANGRFALTVIINGIPFGTPGNVPDLVVDNSPTNCTSWIDNAFGWTELSGFPGNLVISANAECCGSVQTSVGESTPLSIAGSLLLQGNTPNPFNPTTTIRYALRDEGHVRLAVFDVSGRELMVLVDDVMGSGWHEYSLDATALPSGVYFYALSKEGVSEVRKMTLIR